MNELKRILIVDDDEKDVELALESLKESRLANAVDVVHDGEQALAYFADRIGPDLPAVVLLDLKMPKIGGLEVLQSIRQNPATRHVPVVVLSSSRENPDVDRAYELGANAYVAKPVDFDQFINAIGQIGAFWAVLNQVPERGGPK